MKPQDATAFSSASETGAAPPDLASFSIGRRQLWRSLRITTVASLAGAGLFSAIFNETFWRELIDAVCVVALTQSLIAAGRFGLSFLTRASQELPDTATGWRRLPRWPRWQLLMPWVVIASVIGYFGGTALGELILSVFDPVIAVDQHRHMMILGFTIATALTSGTTYFVYLQGRMLAMEARTQKAISAAAENQLRLLQSQLEPHMLFNTLANLRILISRDPLRAQGMLDHLIAYLRATLDASRIGSHPLSTEFERLADYLELMQVRMGERLQTRLSLPGDLAGMPVPPLLLQPLVENAIKHGLEPKVEGGLIEVTARQADDRLILQVRDTGVGLGTLSQHGSRFGLEQIRERLHTLYGDAGTLELVAVDDADGGMIATVCIPLIVGKYEKSQRHYRRG